MPWKVEKDYYTRQVRKDLTVIVMQILSEIDSFPVVIFPLDIRTAILDFVHSGEKDVILMDEPDVNVIYLVVDFEDSVIKIVASLANVLKIIIVKVYVVVVINNLHYCTKVPVCYIIERCIEVSFHLFDN